MATSGTPKTPPRAYHSKIVEDAMPGWKIVDPDEARERREQDLGGPPPSDLTSASMDEMKRKYHPAADAAGADAVENNATLDTHVVTVEAPSGERKTLGIRDGKIAWRQG